MTRIPLIIKIIDMPLDYDLETDIRYLQGVERSKMDVIKRGLQMGTDIQLLSTVTGKSIEEIEQIKKDLELDVDASENQNE